MLFLSRRTLLLGYDKKNFGRCDSPDSYIKNQAGNLRLSACMCVCSLDLSEDKNTQRYEERTNGEPSRDGANIVVVHSALSGTYLVGLNVYNVVLAQIEYG